jgi:O-antigen biosynthesis protein
MLSRILNLMGCYFGDEHVIMEPARDNPKGFWERVDVMHLNNDILGFAGGNWWDVGNLDFSVIQPADKEFIRENMGNILLRLEPHRPWVIKDPRLCLTLDNWLEMLEIPIFLISLRSPIDVAKSLKQRNNIPLEYGLALWEYYTLSFLRSLGSKPRITISYNDLLQKPLENIRELYESLTNMGITGLRLPGKKEIEAFVDPGLCHFESQIENDGVLLSDDQRQLFHVLTSPKPFSPSTDRIEKVLSRIRALKAEGDWAEKLTNEINIETPAQRLKNLEARVLKLEADNIIIETEKQNLIAKNATLGINHSSIQAENIKLQTENKKRAAENTRLWLDIFKIQTENTNLKIENKGLIAKNIEIEAEKVKLTRKEIPPTGDDSELTDRLRAIINSRLVRTAGLLSRVSGRGEKGLAAELKRIKELLEKEATQSPSSGISMSQKSKGLENQNIKKFKATVQFITLERIRNIPKFLIENKGDVSRVLERYKDASQRLRSACNGALSERELSLIDHYNLPRSCEKTPDTMPDINVNKLSEELRLLAVSQLRDISHPAVSIIIPIHNQLRFTMACLHSILDNSWRYAYEIILADDNSTDQTPDIFENKFPAVRYLRHTPNKGFLENCNHAARIARGRYLVFLNNDTIVMKGWLDELIQTLEDNPSAGLVGSKLIYPDGVLQEAGGIIFEDGTGWNYGRFQNPNAPGFNYARDVDYCSAASMAIRTDLWTQLDGFDTRFVPAYYEDTDMAFQVRAAGNRVLYQPLSAVIHFEGVSNGKTEHEGIKKHQALNKQKFFLKWAEILKSHGKPDPANLPADRNIRGRVIFVDATTPTPDRDSGSMDAFNYMKILKELGFHVTFIPSNVTFQGKYTENLQRIGIVCLHQPWIQSPKEALKKYAPKSDIVFLCRVNTAAPLVDIVRQHAPNAKIIFDTVDLHFLREERAAELAGSSALACKAAATRQTELELIKKCHASMFRSVYEMELVRKLVPGAKIVNLPIVRDIPGPSGTPFEKRKDVVFIGGFGHPPNANAVHYFVSEVWPLVRAKGFAGRFIIAGSAMPDDIKQLASDDIVVKGFVENLSDLFDNCLFTVAPLRYGAGAKGKVIQSLTYGVPCVGTSVAAEGCGFVNGKHMLVADGPESMAEAIVRLSRDKDLWQTLAKEGLAYCSQNYSLDAVREILNQSIKELRVS